MNRREAKRTVTSVMARLAGAEANRSRELAKQIRAGAENPTGRSVADVERIAQAYDDIGSELARRVTGDRKPSSPPIDPDQLSILEIP